MGKNEILYKIYLNLFEFCVYRGYTVSEYAKSIDKFESEITVNNYINISTENDYLISLIYNDPNLLKTAEIKKIFKSLPSTYKNIILITKDLLTSSIIKALKESKNDVKNIIFNYKYSPFKIVLPKHIYSNEHIILNEEEKNKLLNQELYSDKNKLAVILLNDPQCIWLGAKVGDIIKIKRKSDIAGYSYYYRTVCKKS